MIQDSSNGKVPLKPFRLTGADGKALLVPAREYYFNTKARCRRLMLDSLSSDARRVYACLELATMGFQQELAVTMAGGKTRPLTPTDVSTQTGLPKQKVRSAFEELEDQGLAKRETDDGKSLRRGHIRLYSWAEPHPTRPNIKEVAARGYFPAWFPTSWEPLRPLISRFKYSLTEDEVAARGYFDEGEEIARRYKEVEEVAARFLKRVCAGGETAAHKEKELKDISERTSSSAVPSIVETLPKAEEEEDPPSDYQTFKKLYPKDHFDEPKTKPAFQAFPKAYQRRVIKRLRVYLDCDRWKAEKGRWIPLASNWLQSYDADPPPVLRSARAPTIDWDENERIIREARATEAAAVAAGRLPRPRGVGK